VVALNGEETSRLEQGERNRRGHLALQCHHPGSRVAVRAGQDRRARRFRAVTPLTFTAFGGTGFLGQRIVRHLHQAGHVRIAVDTIEYRGPDALDRFCAGFSPRQTSVTFVGRRELLPLPTLLALLS